MNDGGKGDSPRPLSVDSKTFANNWDLIFNKGKQFPAKTEGEKQAEAFLKDEYYDQDDSSSTDNKAK